MQKSEVLAVLDLRDNHITLADGKFTNALATNQTLKKLTLDSNKIWNKVGGEGAKHLAEALKVNTTLKEIELSTNQIGDDGAQHLSEALLVNTSLQYIDLEKNNINNGGAQSLAASFKGHQSLRKIYMDGNDIDNLQIACPDS